MLGGGGGSDDNHGNNEIENSDLDKPGLRITHEMMDSVDSLDWLRSELGDGGLRPMIFEINEADRQEGEGRRRRKEDVGIWRDQHR